MTPRCAGLAAVLIFVGSACSASHGAGSGASSTDAGTGSDTTVAGQVAPSVDAATMDAMVKGFTVASLSDHDVIGDDLISAMGVSAALGGEADQILGLAVQSHIAAVSKLPSSKAVISGLRRSVRLGVNDLLWLIVQNDLPTELDPATETSVDEEQTNTQDSTSTTPGSGATATSTVTQTVTASVISSRVQLKIHRVEKVVVADAAGKVSFESTDDRTVTGAIEVCPNTSGVSNATMHTTVSIDATTHPGAAGRVGVHVVGHAETTSDFAGHVDDSAALRNITQTFRKSSDWKRSAAAEGGPVREQNGSLDVAFDGLSTTANTAGEVGVDGMSAAGMTGTAGVTGTGTQEMINNSVGDAAIDVVAISPSYKEAQRLWRNGRCVVVAIPGYNAETSIHTETQEASQHTENVDQGSSTEFTVSQHHRFESSPLTAEIKADLTAGDKSLDPDSLPNGAGALTYVAPDENNKDATVKLVSMSNRGIGTLVVTFHTDTVKLHVTISGSEFFDQFLPLTVDVTPIELTKEPDGSYEGTGQSKTVGSLGPCSPAIIETGTIGLTATRAATADGTPGDWTIRSEKIVSNADIKFYCEMQNQATAFSPLGVAYDFVNDLGSITVPASGGTQSLHVDGTYGPLDATVVVEIITGGG